MLFFSFITIVTMVYGQVNFVAVGDDSAGSFNSIVYSTDGINWTPVVDRIFSTLGYAIYYSGHQSKWMAGGQGNNTLAWSTDGITWYGLGSSVFTSVCTGLAYSPQQNIWVGSGLGNNTLAWSIDGITWNGLGHSVFTLGSYGVTYSAALDRWIACGYGNNTLAYSNDGMNWIGLGSILFSTHATSAVYGGSPPVFISTGLGTANSQAWSNDGITWTGTGKLFGNGQGNAAAYGQNRWLLTGHPTILPKPLANSLDGKTWNVLPSQTPEIANGNGLVYNIILNRWVVVGYPKSIAYSNDGVTWTYANNLFSVTGTNVATNNDVGGSTFNSSYIPAGINIHVTDTFNVDGNLTINGDWSITGNSSTNITNDLNINGSTTFTNMTLDNYIPGKKRSIVTSTPLITTNTLTINSIANVNLVVDTIPTVTVTTVVVIPLIQYQSVTGTFVQGVRSFSITNPNPTSCVSLENQYSSSTLNAVLTINPCLDTSTSTTTSTSGIGGIGVTSSNNSNIVGNVVITTRAIDSTQNYRSVPTGVIVGISIGCIAVVSFVVLLFVFLMRRRSDRYDIERNAELRGTEIENMSKLKAAGTVM